MGRGRGSAEDEVRGRNGLPSTVTSGRPGSMAWGISVSYRYSWVLQGRACGHRPPRPLAGLGALLCIWSRQAFSGGGGREAREKEG